MKDNKFFSRHPAGQGTLTGRERTAAKVNRMNSTCSQTFAERRIFLKIPLNRFKYFFSKSSYLRVLIHHFKFKCHKIWWFCIYLLYKSDIRGRSLYSRVLTLHQQRNARTRCALYLVHPCPLPRRLRAKRVCHSMQALLSRRLFYVGHCKLWGKAANQKSRRIYHWVLRGKCRPGARVLHYFECAHFEQNSKRIKQPLSNFPVLKPVNWTLETFFLRLFCAHILKS